MPALAPFLRRLLADRTAGVSTLATLALPVVIGSAGLAFDLNRGFEQRVANQRAADMAALGTAMAYVAKADTTLLDPTAQAIATANGLAGASVDATLLANFPENGAQAVRVEIARAVPFTLARVLGLSGDYTVRASAIASLGGGDAMATPCYLALGTSSPAIEVTGGGEITVPGCAIAAIGSIAQNGTRIRGKEVISGGGDISLNYGELIADKLRFKGSFTKPGWNGNAPAADKWVRNTVELSDPWGNTAALTAARQQLGNHASAAVGNPTTPNGSNWNLSNNPGKLPDGVTYNASTKTYSVAAGSYTIGKLDIAGGLNVVFASGSNISVAKGVAIGGDTSVNFGNANLYVNGGFDSGTKGITIGDGTLWIGAGTTSFKGTSAKGSGNVLINSTLDLGGGGKLKVGAGDLTVAAGITIGGDGELALTQGNVTLGRASSGNAINLGGSGRLFMGDGQFSADGNINTGGGSRLVFGQTGNHLVNGNMNVAGSALFGSGRYTVNGSFTNGTGGTTWPYTSGLTGKSYGSSSNGVGTSGYDMAGVDVTFIVAGTLNLAGGARTLLFAPLVGDTKGGIPELLLSTLSATDTNWGAGSSSLFSGVVHLPNSQLTMSGGNQTASGTRCMSLIARIIKVTGGAASGTACTSMAGAYGGGGGKIRLLR